MIKLGRKVKDKITGFEGIAIARVEYLTGCTQYCVKPDRLDSNRKMLDGEYIDEGQLEVVGHGINLYAIDEGPVPDNSNGGYSSDTPEEKYRIK